MNSGRKYILFAAWVALILASMACKALQAPVPTILPESTIAPEEIIPSSGSEPTATSGFVQTSGAVYDGVWNGTNETDDSPVVFEVTENQITSVTINYFIDNNGCTYSGAVSMGIDPAPINSNQFSAVFTAANDYTYTFEGSFTSDAEANGTVHIASPSTGLCGVFEKDVTWSAGKDANAEPESAVTQGPQVDSDELVTQFFDALNADDVDSAIALVDENIVFTLGTSVTQFNSASLKNYLSSQDLTYEVSDVQSMAGTIVQFKLKTSDGAVYSSCTAFVDNGKITMMSLYQ